MIAMESKGKSTKGNILKNGSIEVHVKISGIRQRHTLKVEREKTAFGMVPYLVCDKSIPTNELLRLAQELQLPIKCKGMKVFPKGKAAKDFAESEPEKKRSLSHDRILNDKKPPETEKEGKKTGEEKEKESEESDKDAVEEEESEGEEPADEEDENPEESEEETDKQEEEIGEPEGGEGEGAGESEESEAKEKEKKGEKSTESIEIEGSGANVKKNDAGRDTESPADDKPEEKKERKKIFSGVLSEGILT